MLTRWAISGWAVYIQLPLSRRGQRAERKPPPFTIISKVPNIMMVPFAEIHLVAHEIHRICQLGTTDPPKHYWPIISSFISVVLSVLQLQPRVVGQVGQVDEEGDVQSSGAHKPQRRHGPEPRTMRPLIVVECRRRARQPERARRRGEHSRRRDLQEAKLTRKNVG